MPRLTRFALPVLVAACVAGMLLGSPDAGPALGHGQIGSGSSNGIPLERYLWQQGIYPVVGIWSGGLYIDWADAASRSLWQIPAFLLPEGGLSIFGKRLGARDLGVVTGPRPGRSILDVAPTACGALGLGGSFDGTDIGRVNASQVVVIYLDGLGWHRYGWAGSAMQNLSSLGPAPACCVYPSISNVNAAAMGTGAGPERSGIDRWERRETLTGDVIDQAWKNGISAAWIDGPRPPVILRQGMISVQDTNGDGSTDEEVVDRAIAAYENGTRLLYVHLVDTDRALHASGPYSLQSLDSAVRADALIGRLVSHARQGTLLMVVADHGGHEIKGCKGDHGSLLPQDMLIPLAVSLC